MTSDSQSNKQQSDYWKDIEKAINKRKWIAYTIMAVLVSFVIVFGSITSNEQLQLLNSGDTGSTLYLESAENNITQVLQAALNSLTMLAFIALVMERSLEVFVHTLASPRKLVLQAEQEQLQKEDDNTSTPESRQQLERINAALRKLKVTTKMGTLLGALAIGLFLGIAGIRIFEPLFTVESLHAMPLFQQAVLRVMDIALTGLALAGGSDGIHFISKRLGSYVDPDMESPGSSAPTPTQSAS